MRRIKVGIIGNLIKGGFANLISADDSIVSIIREKNHLPIILPITENLEVINGLIEKMDMVIIPNGENISPFLYGEDPRIVEQKYDFILDKSELLYLEIAKSKGKFVLGIGRGSHIINVFHGGNLIQNIEKEVPNSLYHTNKRDSKNLYHYINIDEYSKLYEYMNLKDDIVSSNHDQCINKVGKGLKISAKSKDNCIEVIEGEKLMGIQFEILNEEDDFGKKLFTKVLESVGIQND